MKIDNGCKIDTNISKPAVKQLLRNTIRCDFVSDVSNWIRFSNQGDLVWKSKLHKQKLMINQREITKTEKTYNNMTPESDIEDMKLEWRRYLLIGIDGNCKKKVIIDLEKLE